MTLLPPLNEVQVATECLYSTLRNLSYHRTFFGFLPPHGRLLACGEEITVWGFIQHWLTRFTPNERARRSLEVALSGSAQQYAGPFQDGVKFPSSLTANKTQTAALTAAGVTWSTTGQSAGGRTIPRTLAIVKTPAVHLYDQTTKNTMILWLNNNAFYAIDPCWAWPAGYTSTQLYQASCDVSSQQFLQDPRWVNAVIWKDIHRDHGQRSVVGPSTSSVYSASTSTYPSLSVFPKV